MPVGSNGCRVFRRKNHRPSRAQALEVFVCRGTAVSTIKSIKCPHCRKEAPLAGNPHRPFCSERCKMIDLGTWASEGYAIPGDKAPEVEDDDEFG